MPDSPTSVVCECAESMRSACSGEPIYGAYEGKRFCVLHLPTAGKTADFKTALIRKIQGRNFNFRGVWFPEPPSVYSINFVEDVDFSGAFFSRGADFSHTTFSKKAVFKGCTFSGAGAGFAYAKFKDEADFSNANFILGASFKGATFNNNADFSQGNFGFGAVFEAAHFCRKITFTKTLFPANAFFIQAIFDDEVVFTEVVFVGEADFVWATFKGDVSFFLTQFHSKANFTSVKFQSDVEFNKSDFLGPALFRDALFQNYVGFWGYGEHRIFLDRCTADFQYARIEHSERVSFHTLGLRPHWFVNIDTREFNFINVQWRDRAYEEIRMLKRKESQSAYRLLALAYRQLAVNAEENHRYEEASRFRYRSMNMRRQRNLEVRKAAVKSCGRCLRSLKRDWGLRHRTLERLKTFGEIFWTTGSLRNRWASRDFLYWLYWALSGYGERIYRGLTILIGIWFMSSLLYTQVGFARWEPKVARENEADVTKRNELGAPLTLSRTFTYSLAVMALQKPEPKPATTSAQTIVLLETILGPVQAALLALAIRRKFMR